MKRSWIDKKIDSVSLPNIFDEIVPSFMDTANFVVIDKPEYDLVLRSI
jgi:hypothetical protein